MVFIFLEVDLLVILIRNGFGGVFFINFFFIGIKFEIDVIFLIIVNMNYVIRDGRDRNFYFGDCVII